MAYNFYGPTETTVDSLTAVMHPGTEPTLGDSVANSRHYILDSGLNPVPVNAIGELYVAGINLARGYLDQPGLSAERFVADPFVPDGSRMYRTGDVVRRLPDGTLEFRGRMDAQVKIRGFRIELAEIEEVLRGLDGVEHAAVAVTKNRAGYDQLLGYVTAAGQDDAGLDTAELDTAELRQLARRQLPDYMVPTAVQQIAAIPLTANGKLDTRALPAPEKESAVSAPPQRAGTDRGRGLPGSPGARRRRAGRSTSSTSAATPCWRPGSWPCCGTGPASPRRCGPCLNRPPWQPSPKRSSCGAGTANALGPVERPAVIPLSFAQRRLWFLNRFDPGSGAYNIPVVLELEGALDVPALRGAINQVADRHESLRTVFPLVDGEPAQRILSGHPVELLAVQCTAEALPGALAAETRRGFDVTRELPLRAVLFQLAPDHHVAGHYAAPHCRGRLVPGPARAGSLTRLQRPGGRHGHPLGAASGAVRRLHAVAARRTGQRGRSGERHLPPARVLDPRTARSPRRAAAAVRFQPGRAERRRTGVVRSPHHQPGNRRPAQRAGAANTTPASLWCCRRRSRPCSPSPGAGEDIPLGTPVAGRTDTQLNELVGFFVNTLVLRTNTSGNPTAAELVESVRYTNLHAYANQDAPFERIVEELNPARSQHRHPLFQVMLTLQNTAAAGLSMDGLEATADLSQEPGGAKFDLLLDLVEESAGDGPETTPRRCRHPRLAGLQPCPVHPGHRRAARGRLPGRGRSVRRGSRDHPGPAPDPVPGAAPARPGAEPSRPRTPDGRGRAGNRRRRLPGHSGPDPRRVGAHRRRRYGRRRQLRPAPWPGPVPRQGAGGLRRGAGRPGRRGPAAHGRRRRCRTGGAGRGRGLHPGGPLLPGGADPGHPRGRRSRRRDLRRTGVRRPRLRGSADPGRRSRCWQPVPACPTRPWQTAARPPKTWPTCSTPPVPPDAPRAWPCRTAPSPTSTGTTTAPCTPRASRPPDRTAPCPWRTSPASASTPPGTRCCGWSPERSSTSWPTRSAATPSRLPATAAATASTCWKRRRPTPASCCRAACSIRHGNSRCSWPLAARL